MKKLWMFSVLLILLHQNGISQALKVLMEPDIKEMMSDICFVDVNTGWMVGTNGSIYKTTNAGVNWTQQQSGVNANLTKVTFIDANNGWVGSSGGSVLKTVNAGQTWTEVSLKNVLPNFQFSLCDALYFKDATTGFVVAGQSKKIYLFKTNDGGNNWAIKDSLVGTSARRWYDVEFRKDKGVIVGDKKDIQKYSTDGGETWQFSTPINDNFFRDLKAVRWLSDNTVLAIGEGNEFYGVVTPVYKSIDGGINWTKKSQSLSFNKYDRVKDAYFKDSLNGIGIGNNGFSREYVVKTSDGGETWTAASPDYAFGLIAISGINDAVYALGINSHVIKSTDFGGTWQLIPQKVTSSIYGIQFIGGKGIAVSRNGDVYLNKNGVGKEWEIISSASANECYAMQFLTPDVGFILKENSHIVKTTDGGYTWKTVLPAAEYSSRNRAGGITFGDLNNGYAWFSINDYGEYYIFKTTDQGETWKQVNYTAGPGYISGDVISFDANTAVLLGPDTWSLRTTDGGATWNSASINNLPAGFETKDFEDVCKLDNNSAIAIGEKFICTTSDKGATWNYLNHGIAGTDSAFYTLNFRDINNGYIGCYDGVILGTTNGGVSWTVDSTFFDKYYLYSSAYTELGKIFFGTSNGYIIGEEATVGIKAEKNNRPVLFELKQNYPNPFNPSTIIEFNIPKSDYVTLKVYDVLGREIATLVSKEMTAGSYKMNFNASEISGPSSGVYIYKLTAGAYSAAKKLIILK